MSDTAINVVYPVHYVQFFWIGQLPSKIRKLIYSGTNAEGWAHYCEQMMLDEGYGAGDAHLRLGQLQAALQRNARFIVGIEMHTGKMSFEQGVQFFEKEGYQSHQNALRETKRGTSDPTYLVYTLGKLEIDLTAQRRAQAPGDSAFGLALDAGRVQHQAAIHHTANLMHLHIVVLVYRNRSHLHHVTLAVIEAASEATSPAAPICRRQRL